jgi:MFS family permease
MAEKVNEEMPEHLDRTNSEATKLGDSDKEKELEQAQSNLARVATFSKDLERRVRRKLDWNIVPLVLVLYMLSVLDRSNVGNARIAGMSTDLDLVGNRYDWLLTIFYIPCNPLPITTPSSQDSLILDILFEWLTILWKVFPAHRYAATVVFLWGLAATMQAATTTWAGMMVCRFFLGAIECGFGPGLPLYLSFFYPRHEVGLRIGIFLSGSALANAYGGALAYGLSHITSGIAPWRLLFILEGVPTCILAVVVWFCLPDSPGKCRFLNAEEREVAVARAQRQPRAHEFNGLSIRQLFSAFKDYKSISPF